MGLFKFGKKTKSSKSAGPAAISTKVSTMEPGNEKMVLDLAVANTDTVLSFSTKADMQNTSLMDDIFGELSGQSTGENKWKPLDDLQSDAGLTLQLARALELDNNKTSNIATDTATLSSHSLVQQPKVTLDNSRPNGIFAADSIYGNGVSLISNTRADGWLTEYHNITAALSTTTPATKESPSHSQQQTAPSEERSKPPVVLDSDISDSEEDEDSEQTDDEYRDNHKVLGRPSHLKLQNKYKQKRTAETQQEMMDKMKERHRAEANTAHMRSQCLRVQQHTLSSSSRYHSMQSIPSAKIFVNANPMTTLPPNYPSHTPRLPMARSMQDLSSRMDAHDPIGYSQGRASPLARSIVPPYQLFNRGHPKTPTSYVEQTVRAPYTLREGIIDVLPASHVKAIPKKRLNALRLGHPSEKTSVKENGLRKSKSFTNDQHTRRRYMDSDLPPMPASPCSEPGFDYAVSDSKQSHQVSLKANRMSSNNSFTTENSDTPNLPLTPSETYETPPHRVKLTFPSDAEPKAATKPQNGVVKHTKSEGSLRRAQLSCTEEDEDDHVLAMKDDSELKWHYRSYRQQNVYTSFSDYLTATQYQKMMVQHQQHIIYNPYPLPAYLYH